MRIHTVYRNPTYNGAIGVNQMNVPHWSVLNGHILHQHVFRFPENHEIRTHTFAARTFPKIGSATQRHPGGRSSWLNTPPIEPMPGLSIQHPFAGDGGISYPVGVDQRRIVVGFYPLVTLNNNRQIILLVLTEKHLAAFCKMQINVAEQVDGTGKPLSRRNNDLSPTAAVGFHDRVVNGLGTFNTALRTSFLSPKITNIEFPACEFRSF